MNTLFGKVPLLIPTLCRFEHLKRCIESFKKNKLSEYVPLIIAVDYPSKEEHFEGYEKILNYLKTLTGFYSIEIIYRKYNWGVINNYFELVKYANSKYDYFMFSEDDIEYSSNYVEFIFQGIKLMQEDSNILAVCGYSSNNYKHLSCNAIYSHSFCAWGYAMKTSVFLEKTEYIITSNYASKILNNLCYSLIILKNDILGFNLLIDEIKENDRYEDVSLSCYSFLNKKYKFIVPTVSKTRNHGYDGSGVHCSISNNFISHYIDNESSINLDFNEEIEDTSKKVTEIKQIVFSLIRYFAYHIINNKIMLKLKNKFRL